MQFRGRRHYPAHPYRKYRVSNGSLNLPSHCRFTEEGETLKKKGDHTEYSCTHCVCMHNYCPPVVVVVWQAEFIEAEIPVSSSNLRSRLCIITLRFDSAFFFFFFFHLKFLEATRVIWMLTKPRAIAEIFTCWTGAAFLFWGIYRHGTLFRQEFASPRCEILFSSKKQRENNQKRNKNHDRSSQDVNRFNSSYSRQRFILGWPTVRVNLSSIGRRRCERDRPAFCAIASGRRRKRYEWTNRTEMNGSWREPCGTIGN